MNNIFIKFSAFLAIIGAAFFGFANVSQANNDGEDSKNKKEIIVTLADFEKEVTANKSVKRSPVTFKNQNLKMSGLLFSPADMNESKKYPAIVVVHPRSTISYYESGKRESPLPVLLGYAKLANIYVDVLIDDEINLPEKLPSRKKSSGVLKEK
ncbi:MAG TPA: hypothetical protein VF604_05600 [Pyrinomonadaceae bacterium]|jgi:hypothetical protein